MVFRHNSRRRADRLSSLLVIALLTMISVKASAENNKIKAAFIYRLATMTTWPESALGKPDATLCFAIVGDDPLAQALAKLIDGRLLHDRRTKVLAVSGPSNLPECIVAFFSRRLEAQSNRNPDRTIASMASVEPPALTLGDSKDFAERGGMVQFIREDRHLRFIVDLKSLKARDLKLSSKVLRLAKKVIQ